VSAKLNRCVRIAFAIAVGVVGALGGVGTSSEAKNKGCVAVEKEWDAWRDKQVLQYMAPTTVLTAPNPEKLYVDVDRIAKTALTNTEILGECPLTGPKKLSNFMRFTNTVKWTEVPDHSYGFSVSDREFIAYAAPYITVPDLLKSHEFQAAISSRETYFDAYQMILDHNKTLPPQRQWQVIIYDSQFITSADDTTYGRFFIYIPDEATAPNGDKVPVYKWTQFSIFTPASDHSLGDGCKPEAASGNGFGVPHGNTCTYSMVAVRSLGERRKTEVYLVDFRRLENKTTSKMTMVPRTDLGLAEFACSHCHKSPVLPLHPARTYEFSGKDLVEAGDKFDDVIYTLNQRIESDYGPPNFGPWLDVTDFGPGIGPLIDRSDAYLKSCSKGLDVRLDRVREAMNCSSCHNGQSMGVINYPQATFSTVDTEFLTFPAGSLPNDERVRDILSVYIEEGLMPPPALQSQTQNDLTPDERSALLSCLMTEYFDPQTRTGLLVDWLKKDVQ
jgi:hypothetical protein